MLGACAVLSVATTIGIIVVLLEQAIQFFRDMPVSDFLFGTKWTALFKDGEFGVIPLVAGTLFIPRLPWYRNPPGTHVGDLPERVCLAPAAERAQAEPRAAGRHSDDRLRLLRADIRHAKVLKSISPATAPYNVLAGAIAVGVMVLPMIASLSEDAMRAVPRSLREGAYRLGATKLEDSTRVVMPAALSGITQRSSWRYRARSARR